MSGKFLGEGRDEDVLGVFSSEQLAEEYRTKVLKDFYYVEVNRFQLDNPSFDESQGE